MDMLLSAGEQISIALCAMALEAMGLPVISLCAWQVGLHTSSTYSDLNNQTHKGPSSLRQTGYTPL